ncbi:MAG: right-handed parallel beta-helix repeat-containing protein [Pirellulaceae bacterium]|nr:right-handed parallel beta-helix repeat-containing protein [Pirellulaceae bacterium]
MNAIHLLASSHIEITGFDVTSKGSAIRLADTRFIGVHDNFIHDVDGWANDNLSGIYLTDAHSSTLEGNLLRDIFDRNQPESQNSRPIVIFGSVDVRVLDNVVWNSQPETGFGIEYKHLGSLTPAQAAAMTFEVTGNTIINVGGNGVGTSAPNSWIHHNLLVDPGGFRVDDIGGTHQLAGELIEYNTIINTLSDRLGSGSLAYDPTETVDSPRGAFPLGTVEFVHNLVVDRRAYDHSERRTLSVYRYGSDNEYRASIGMGKFRSDRNFFDTQSSALFDLFGSDYESLGGDFDFSQWQAMGIDRSGSTGSASLDNFFRPNHSDARQTGWYAGSDPRLTLLPLDRNLTEAGIVSEQRIRLTRNGGSLSLPVVVTLSTPTVNQLNLPSQVTIPAGAASVEFVVQGVADLIEEGPQAISIHAATPELATSTWLMMADSDADANTSAVGVFQVPSSGGGRASMDSVVTERLAEYDNELGWAYVDDAQGRVNGLLPADVGWLSELLSRSAPQTIFSSGATEGNRSSVELEAGRFGVWYLVQDAGLEEWLSLNPENSLSVRPLVFTSIANANPDRYQHLRSTTTESQWQLAWEDQEFGGDESFRDFSISVAFSVIEP